MCMLHACACACTCACMHYICSACACVSACCMFACACAPHIHPLHIHCSSSRMLILTSSSPWSGGVALAPARAFTAGESRAARKPLPSPKPAGGRGKPADGSTHTREPLELPPPAAQRAAGAALWRRQERSRAAPRFPLSCPRRRRRRALVRALLSALGGRRTGW